MTIEELVDAVLSAVRVVEGTGHRPIRLEAELDARTPPALRWHIVQGGVFASGRTLQELLENSVRRLLRDATDLSDAALVADDREAYAIWEDFYEQCGVLAQRVREARNGYDGDSGTRDPQRKGVAARSV